MEANLIKEILHRKAKGIDCTENESSKLKGFIKKTVNSSEAAKLALENKAFHLVSQGIHV